MIRWHLDVGDDHVRVLLLGDPNEFAGIARRPDDIEATVQQDPQDPFPYEWLILTYEDADLLVCIHRCDGYWPSPKAACNGS